MKKKLKWKYDKKSQEWWIGESIPWANDGMRIKKRGTDYKLEMDYPNVKVYFKKFSVAKKVAELIYHGI